MLLFARKKFVRDDRLVQLMLLLSILRGIPDELFDIEDSQNVSFFENELSFGSLYGQGRIPTSPIHQEMYPKSLDRMLANYQRSLLDDLNALGRFSLGRRDSSDIHAYLLNAESSIASSSNSEGNPSTGPVSPEPPPLLATAESSGPQQLRGRAINLDFEWDPDMGMSFEDLEAVEALWKQDVDMGIPREIFEELQDEDDDNTFDKLSVAMPKFKGPKDKDFDKDPDDSSETDELPEDKQWSAALNCTLDSETGELLATNVSNIDEPPPPSSETELLQEANPALEANATDFAANNSLEFNIDEALKLIGIEAEEDQNQENLENPDLEPPPTWSSPFSSSSPLSGTSGDSGYNDQVSAGLDALSDTVDDMIQAYQHNSRSGQQGRLGTLVRGGSMEQRWQDLASLLSLPSPEHAHHQSPPISVLSHAQSPPSALTHGHHHVHGPAPQPLHHPHALYPTHQQHQHHNVTTVGAMHDQGAVNVSYNNSMGASSHLVASSMNLTNTSEIQGTDVSSHHPSHHQGQQHHQYKMESSGTNGPIAPMPQNMQHSDMMYYQATPGGGGGGGEMGQQQQQQQQQQQSTDGFLSSILGDEDLQLMDIPMHDYNGRSPTVGGGGEYPAAASGSAYSRYPAPEDPHTRLQPVAPQKKHHMYGKRFFQENTHGPSLGGGSVQLIPNPYTAHYPSPHTPAPMEGATALDPEMKYSCTMDFRGQNELSASSIDHNVQHNHTYHMSDGPSGLNRTQNRDKKGRKNESERNLSRDQKRARAMNLPINCDDIINLPMDEFNERISKYDLTEAQLSLIRDIRRRGKNKVAAQNCRKRKLDQIVHLAEEVKVIHYRKSDLCLQYDQLTSERARINHKFSLLYRHIFQSLRDPDGNPYSPHEFSLQQSADGSILLVPRSAPNHTIDYKHRHSKDD